MSLDFERLAAYSAAVVITVVASSSCASESAKLLETLPNAEREATVLKLFQTAKRLKIHYSPAAAMGRGEYAPADIDANAKLVAEYRCTPDCSLSAPKLLETFSSGLRVSQPCPGRFTASLWLYDGAGSIPARFYVHESWQCFTWEGQSFYIDRGTGIASVFQQLDALSW